MRFGCEQNFGPTALFHISYCENRNAKEKCIDLVSVLIQPGWLILLISCIAFNTILKLRNPNYLQREKPNIYSDTTAQIMYVIHRIINSGTNPQYQLDFVLLTILQMTFIWFSHQSDYLTLLVHLLIKWTKLNFVY